MFESQLPDQVRQGLSLAHVATRAKRSLQIISRVLEAQFIDEHFSTLPLTAAMASTKVLIASLSLCAAYDATATHFPYEQDHLTTENINDVLSERLPKQSRIQGSDIIDYVSQFLFSPIKVTGNHKTSVDYDLLGPDNCKVFPGDHERPSRWSWSGLELATLGGLIKPVPMSQVCYTNRTGSADDAACANLAENWNTAKFMQVSSDGVHFLIAC
jgi:hypothetical protein